MSHWTKELLTAYMYFGDKERVYPGERYPGGGNAAYRAHVFKEVGLFNTDLGRKGDSLMGAEEKDIFDKMRAKAWRPIYLPQMILHHIIPQKKLEQDYFDRLTLQMGKASANGHSLFRNLNMLLASLKKVSNGAERLCYGSISCLFCNLRRVTN